MTITDLFVSIISNHCIVCATNADYKSFDNEYLFIYNSMDYLDSFPHSIIVDR